MPGQKRECRSCRKMMRSDNLKNHEKICTGGSTSDTFTKISAMAGMKEPRTEKSKEPVKNGVSEVNPPISITQLRSDAHTSNSLRTNRELLENLMLLIYEIDGNDSLKQKMLAILKQLSQATCSINDFDEEKSDEDTTEIKDEIQNSDEDESMDDETDDEINIYDLTRETAKNLTKNLRENLHKLLFDIDFGYFDGKIRKMIRDFLEGEENAESVTEILRNDLDSMKIKMIINEINRVREKVKEVLQRLTNIHDSDVIKTLESLKLGEQITDEQFKRMAMVDNDLASFAKAMAGSGLWLGRK